MLSAIVDTAAAGAIEIAAAYTLPGIGRCWRASNRCVAITHTRPNIAVASTVILQRRRIGCGRTHARLSDPKSSARTGLTTLIFPASCVGAAAGARRAP
ncbi:hypothetical protein [Burkholderia cepacia]|uniref:hypothetical protein n=1 Tax=Burkholderia cepacia TaxID=292 RepID=UPI0021AB79DE|nr:hypothetical protein [Burkholderia cepacia]